MALGSRPVGNTHRRGRPWLFFALLITVLALIVNAAISARSPGPARQQAQQSYLDQALPSIEQSSAEGLDINDTRSKALTLSPATLTSHLGGVVTQAQQTLAAVEKLNPPSALRNAHSLLVAALDMRYVGTKALSHAMTTILSAQPVDAGVAAMSSAGLDFQASDEAYLLFQQAMPAINPPIPDSRWVPSGDAYSSATLSVFVSSLRSEASSTPVHDVSVVVVTTNPVPVNVINGLEMLPVTRSLSLQIVVADVGNQPEKNLTVTATISPSAIGPTQSVRDFVDLTPGQTRTVSLGGLRVLSGQATTLTAHIDMAPGQTDIADNSKVITLEMQ